MKNCVICNEEIHPMRLEILPNTTRCVKCSNEAPKAGRLVTYGTGEEIFTQLEVVDNETFKKIQRMERGYAPTEEDFSFEVDDDVEQVENFLQDTENDM